MQRSEMKKVSRNLWFTKQSDVLKKLVALKIAQKGASATAKNPEVIEYFQSFVENPHISTYRTAKEYQINRKSMCKILKQNKFHTYNIHLVQKLNKDDFDRCL